MSIDQANLVGSKNHSPTLRECNLHREDRNMVYLAEWDGEYYVHCAFCGENSEAAKYPSEAIEKHNSSLGQANCRLKQLEPTTEQM